MKENNLPELLNCPFCGGKANLIGASDAYFSMCSECGAESAIETRRSAVIAAWNKRADTSAISAAEEQRLMQLAGISTAAIGYWKEGDSVHPDYDTVALRDVAKLYAKYDELYKGAADRAKREVMSDERIQEIIDGIDFSQMVTADDLFFLIARALLANAPQVPTSSADYQQQRGAYADIVDEAISSYEQWLLEDDYDVHGFLKKMIERMRGRRALYAAAPQPEQKE